MAEALQIHSAPISGQRDRVALYFGAVVVAHACNDDSARLVARGWAARMDLRRRLPPRSVLGEDRKAWLRGWDRANEYERRTVAA